MLPQLASRKVRPPIRQLTHSFERVVVSATEFSRRHQPIGYELAESLPLNDACFRWALERT
jgi:hypothetical protein